MVVYNNVLAGAAGSGGDGYKVERSLRFNSADTAQLSARFLSFTDINTGTISFWIKRSGLGAGVIAAGWDGGVSYSGSIQFNSSDDTLQVSMGGSASYTFKTHAALRDVSSWYHVVAAWNRSASAADKVKVWINGVAQTSSDTGYQSWTSGNCQIWAANNGNRIGRGDGDRYTNQLNGYLAEYHYVDGQALDETSFGEYDNNGVWQPKDCKDDLTYGTAGFYLSFSDTSTNSALGLDQSPGRTQDPTATTYGLITGGSVSNVFDGVASYTSELSIRPNGSGVTLDTPVTATSSVRIYGSSERTSVARYQINGTNTSAVPQTYPSRGWTTISGLTFPITINSFGVGGAQSNDGARLSAIEIDGTVLTGTANDWTVSNMSAPTGAAVTISEAAGALPIRNTTGDQGGTAASGFRTDANASSLFLALPLNTNTSDVSNSINSNSTTKSTTNQSTTTSSSQSKFYGASSYWNANSDGILVAQSGSELVLGTGDFTIELWFRDDSNHSGGGSGRCYLFDNRIGGSIVGDPPTLTGYVDGSHTISYGASGGGTISHSLSTDNKWIHFAAVRNSSTTTFYINGTSVGSHGDTTNYTNNGFGIGRATDGGYGWAGYIQDFRVYKTAKYTSNFSVPAGPDTSVGAACDSLIDSPTDYKADSGNNGGNYCTLNVLDKRSTVTLSNGNLDATTSTSHWSGVKGTLGVSSGKYYYEVTYGNGNAGRIFVGICGHDVDIDPNSYVQDDTTERAKGMLLFCDNGQYQLDTASRVNMTSQPVTGDVIGVAFDLDNNTAQFYKNGTALGSIDISGSTLASTTVVPIVVVYQSGVNHNFNAGQRPFAYPVSGYSTLCTTNLPDPLIDDPTTEFDTVLYTGNNQTTQTVALPFDPGLVWQKKRSGVSSHYLFDAIRGFNNTKAIGTHTTAAEGNNSAYYSISASGSNLTLGDVGVGNEWNINGQTHVIWTWDGGNLATNSDTTNYNQSQSFSAVTKAGSTTYSPSDSDTGFLNAYPPSNAFDSNGVSSVCYTNNNSVWIYVQLSTAITVSSTIKFGARNTVQVKINGTDYSYTGGDGTSSQTTRTISFSGSLTEFAIRDDDNSGYSTGLSFLEVDGKQLIDPGVIPIGSMNSSIYDRSKPWSSLVTTSSLHTSYNSYGPNSKFGCFDGKSNTSMYSAGGPLTITFDASAFPASGGPYFVEVETNQRGIKVNGQPSSGYTTDIAPNQATYWANNGSVNSLQSVEVNQASNAYGGMCSRIRVNGKVLADSINTSVTWSNAITALANSSLTNPANGFNGNEGNYCDSTAGFTLDLSGHTFGTGTHTIELLSGGASSFTVNGTTSLSGSGSGAIVWSGTHTGELTSLTSSATGASLYYIKVDGEYLLDPGQDFVDNFPAAASTIRANTTAGFSIVKVGTPNSTQSRAHGLGKKPDLIICKSLASADSWHTYHSSLGYTKYINLNGTGSAVSSDQFGSQEPDSNLFYVKANTGSGANKSGGMVYYIWTSIEGFSKFGSYVSNNSTDGPFVWLGFQAKLIIWKNADASHGWYMYDDARDPDNPMSKYLAVHSSNAEGDPGGVMDVLSNGFKVRNTGLDMNTSTNQILYMAWAESPFKYNRAR